MGLDIYCRCGTVNFSAGSYTGFNWWRHTLAKICGLDLELFWVKYPLARRNGEERFFELLNHSDCDGKLSYSECKRLLEDFKWLESQLLPRDKYTKLWWKIFLNVEDVDFFLKGFKEWHKAIRHVIEKKCNLEFG